jgi:hypothetical protein
MMAKEDAAKAGYDAALRLVDKEARTIWSVFTSMIGVNALLVAFSELILKHWASWPRFGVWVGLLGVAVCGAWLLLMNRNFGFYKYYWVWAREFERAAFGDDVQMIRRGKAFADGNEVEVPDDGKVRIERLPWLGRFFKAEWLIYGVIGAFGLVYVSYLLRFLC